MEWFEQRLICASFQDQNFELIKYRVNDRGGESPAPVKTLEGKVLLVCKAQQSTTRGTMLQHRYVSSTDEKYRLGNRSIDKFAGAASIAVVAHQHRKSGNPGAGRLTPGSLNTPLTVRPYRVPTCRRRHWGIPSTTPFD